MVIILSRTYHKDGDILIKNLCSTLNIFVNRNKYKFGVILDDESHEDHTLGDLLISTGLTDYIYYEPLPDNHLNLFQALAYPCHHWGYDRQQWSTFYMDTFTDHDVIGVVDSDSTLTSYLTDEVIFTNDNKIKLKGVKPLVGWKHWAKESESYVFKNGAQHKNDDVALKFETTIDLMATNMMPIFFWKDTFKNFRNYIADVWGMSFNEAYKCFSREPYCQFNILANYALKFESDRYEFVDLFTDLNGKLAVAQNGCPTTRDVLAGVIRSFNIPEDDLKAVVIKSSTLSSFGGVSTDFVFHDLINDTRHSNNFSYFVGNPCSSDEIDVHYQNVKRDLLKLSNDELSNLVNRVDTFIKNRFNNIIVKG